MHRKQDLALRVLKSISILLFVPLFGLFIALAAGAVALRLDPNLQNGVRPAPGDGILVLLFIFLSLIISIPTSLVLAVKVLLRTPAATTRAEDQVATQVTT